MSQQEAHDIMMIGVIMGGISVDRLIKGTDMYIPDIHVEVQKWVIEFTSDPKLYSAEVDNVYDNAAEYATKRTDAVLAEHLDATLLKITLFWNNHDYKVVFDTLQCDMSPEEDDGTMFVSFMPEGIITLNANTGEHNFKRYDELADEDLEYVADALTTGSYTVTKNQ